MTDIKTRLVRTETIHFPRNTADDHSEDREVLVNPDGPEAAAYIAEFEDAAKVLVNLVIEQDHKRLCQGRNYACECGYDQEVLNAAEALSKDLTPNKTGAAS